MEHLSDELEEFVEDIRPHIQSAVDASFEDTTQNESSESERVVVTSLEEAASWAEGLIKDGKLS